MQFKNKLSSKKNKDKKRKQNSQTQLWTPNTSQQTRTPRYMIPNEHSQTTPWVQKLEL